MAKRFDNPVTLDSSAMLPNGMLRASVRLSRTGVFTYHTADGVRRELRSDADVFDAAHLDSFALAPVTLDHPAEPVTASNAKSLAVGSIGAVTRDGIYLTSQILVTDSAAVAAIVAGKQQISLGYYCDHEPAPAGATHDGEPYDYVQRNIRGNHVAIVDVGRAGPEVRIKLDTADGTQSPQEKIMPTETIVVDGAALLADAKKSLDVQTARADAAESKLAAVTAQLQDIEVRAEREAVLAKCTGIITADCKDMDARAIKCAAIKQLSPGVTTDSKSDDYVSAAFDFAIANHKPANIAAEKISAEVALNADVSVDNMSPRAKMIAHYATSRS
jgi:uncharacterized protein